MKVSRGQLQLAPPSPATVTRAVIRYADDIAQSLAQIPGRPELVESLTSLLPNGEVKIVDTYKSYADGMEFIITIENGRVGHVSANTVGAR